MKFRLCDGHLVNYCHCQFNQTCFSNACCLLSLAPSLQSFLVLAVVVPSYVSIVATICDSNDLVSAGFRSVCFVTSLLSLFWFTVARATDLSLHCYNVFQFKVVNESMRVHKMTSTSVFPGSTLSMGGGPIAEMHPITALVQSFLLDGAVREELGAKLQLKDSQLEKFEFAQRWNLTVQSDKLVHQLAALGTEILELEVWVRQLDVVEWNLQWQFGNTLALTLLAHSW